MIDVHSHIIPFVDDGSNSLDISISMIEEEIKQGVDKIICTPHFRKGVFEKTGEEIKSNFDILKKEVERKNLPVALYLGREITIDRRLKDVLKDDYTTINGSEYLLLEFPYTAATDVDEVCYEASLLGFKPIIAHIERYSYFRNFDEISAVRKNGALVQVNANALAGKCGLKDKIFIKGLLTRNLVDLVGSDVHHGRQNYMADAYLKVKKKYPEIAEKIFISNAEKIIK